MDEISYNPTSSESLEGLRGDQWIVVNSQAQTWPRFKTNRCCVYFHDHVAGNEKCRVNETYKIAGKARS